MAAFVGLADSGEMKINVTSEILLVRIKDDCSEELPDLVATEVSYTLIVNGFELVGLRCTPMELDALAVGFLVSEGIIFQLSELDSVQRDDRTFAVRVQLSNLRKGWEEKFQKKTITSGCGYGVTFTDGSKLNSLPVDNEPLLMSTQKLRSLLKSFMDRSAVFKATGGVHSAALVADGEILFFAEDIGRHNAVDKVIGQAFLQDVPVTDKVLLSSGRISGEIMTKVIRSRIPVLISRAAPTCMAINYAEFHGVTLIGFARGNRLNIYTHPQRLKFAG